jgi:predicted nucleic acid-binding Zn ribbon protein
MRRLAPRALSTALEGVVRDAAPATLLARVQGVWTEVAGAGMAAAAAPVSERDGVVTFACESGVWAQELELLAPDLLARLNAALSAPGGSAGTASAAPAAAASGPVPVRELRFRVGSGPNPS